MQKTLLLLVLSIIFIAGCVDTTEYSQNTQTEEIIEKDIEEQTPINCPEHHEKTETGCKRVECEDGTLVGDCSKNIPFFCDENGDFSKKPFKCCPVTGYGESCKPLLSDPKNVTFFYYIKGREYRIDYTVYGGLYDYLEWETNVATGALRDEEGEYILPSDEKEYTQFFFDDVKQKLGLLPLVDEIRKRTNE